MSTDLDQDQTVSGTFVQQREPAGPQRTPQTPPAASDPLHGGMGVRDFYSLHALAAVFPVTAGLLFYGWRGAGVLVMVVGAAALATAVWRRIGARGPQLDYAHTLWLSLLLAMMLPAHLASGGSFLVDDAAALWPILPGAGFVLVMFIWLLGGLGSGRVHPVLLGFLTLVIFFHPALVPQWVLQRQHVLLGDPLDAPAELRMGTGDSWLHVEANEQHQGLRIAPASQRLYQFTSGIEYPEATFGAWLSLEALLRDRMPPLEDLIIGGHPGPVGAGSALAVLIAGLFLIYRGLIDYRIPLIVCVATFVALLVLPVPVVITEEGAMWRWVAAREPGVGWATAITFANYGLFAGPMLFTAFFLATAPAIRPMAKRGRAIYAVLIGITAAAAQLYVSVMIGPYLALLAVSLLTPSLDKFFRPRALV